MRAHTCTNTHLQNIRCLAKIQVEIFWIVNEKLSTHRLIISIKFAPSDNNYNDISRNIECKMYIVHRRMLITSIDRSLVSVFIVFSCIRVDTECCCCCSCDHVANENGRLFHESQMCLRFRLFVFSSI